MKIIFRAHIHEPTGWGVAGRLMLKELSCHYPISVESINFQRNTSEEWIPQLENQFTDADVIIHHVLGDKIKRRSNMKNIAVILIETENISATTWPDYLNTMDEVWVTNNSIKATLKVDVPVFVIPYPIDTAKYQQNYTPAKLDQISGTYKFYTIGENVPRKNIFDLVSCFHLEFDPQEPVSLTIKTNEDLEEALKNVKQRLALYPKISDYKDENVIDQYVDDNIISSIHKLCDCFITTSFGEAWCLPLVDACGFGNSVIGPNYGGPKDILPKECQFDTTSRFCIGNSNYKHVYQNGFDSWRIPDIDSVRKLMRQAYTSGLPKVDLSNFSKNNFITKIRERLNHE